MLRSGITGWGRRACRPLLIRRFRQVVVQHTLQGSLALLAAECAIEDLLRRGNLLPGLATPGDQ
ncbi:MAG: hypothetical protein C4346_14520 [Chloroflexota bacterium]